VNTSGLAGNYPARHDLSGERTMTSSCTTSYGNTYEFSFERQSDGTVRAYIESQPSYGYRDTDPQKIHRNQDGSRHYVCVLEPIPRTISEAKVIAEEWARRNDRYIRSGVSFDAPGRSPAENNECKGGWGRVLID